MLVLQKGLILPVPIYGGSYFFIQPFFCNHFFANLDFLRVCKGFCIALTLDLLGFTTFLREIFTKSGTLAFLYDISTTTCSFIPQQVRFPVNSCIPAVAGVSSISTYYSLVQRWNSVLSFHPLRVPIQLI